MCLCKAGGLAYIKERIAFMYQPPRYSYDLHSIPFLHVMPLHRLPREVVTKHYSSIRTAKFLIQYCGNQDQRPPIVNLNSLNASYNATTVLCLQPNIETKRR